MNPHLSLPHMIGEHILTGGVFMPQEPLILQRGMTIVPVGNLQEQLCFLGFPLMLVDNVFGDQTEAAVRQFQASVGLEPTGVVDPVTWRRMFGGEPLSAEPVVQPTQAQIGPVIRVVLSLRRLYLYENGQLVADYPVAIGKPTTPTPVGEYRIFEKELNPGGAFGTRWMAFTERRHGIHGTNQPESIGQAVSNGCVRMFNPDVEALYDRVPLDTPVIVETGAVIPPDGFYTVQPGDTLYSVALRFDTTVEALIQANNLASDIIFPGQQLRIAGAAPPPPIQYISYTVSPGDTLFSLALRFGATVEAIMRANDLSQDIIFVGQVLRIPATVY